MCPQPPIFVCSHALLVALVLTFVPPVTSGLMNCESSAARNKCNAMMDPTNGNLRACGARETPAFVRRTIEIVLLILWTEDFETEDMDRTFSSFSGRKILKKEEMERAGEEGLTKQRIDLINNAHRYKEYCVASSSTRKHELGHGELAPR
jgi:hypothetical protein